MRRVLRDSAKTYVGIDNGVSGSVGVVDSSGVSTNFLRIPIFECQDYNKEKKRISRIDTVTLEYWLKQFSNVMVLLERPMKNPGRFNASISALRALEATLIVLERLDFPHMFVDSKEWQQDLLPKGVKGSDALKKASLDIGKRLFPEFKDLYHNDADGILIAEWGRRQNF